MLNDETINVRMNEDTMMYPEETVPQEGFEFFDERIRYVWDKEKEEFYFSVVDVIQVLTEQPDTRRAAKYWSVLKTRLKQDGSELTTICSQLKLKAADGKFYKTDVATMEEYCVLSSLFRHRRRKHCRKCAPGIGKSIG